MSNGRSSPEEGLFYIRVLKGIAFKGFLLGIVFAAGVQPLSAGTTFTLNFGKRYRVVERQDLRIRKDGQYKGFLYREYRAFLRATSGSARRYEGEYYILENMKRNAFLTAKAVDKQYKTTFTMGPRGNILVDKKYLVPVHRNFPAFPPRAVAPGESWDVSGSDLVSDSTGNRTRVSFLCHYVFRGKETYQNRPVSIIDAQYALRYSGKSSTSSASRIQKISGKRKAAIVLYTDAKGGIFIKSDIKQRIEYTDGSTEETEGFILTWYTGASGLLQETPDTKLVDTFTAIKKSGMNLSLEKSAQGLVLKIQHIHFVPNSAAILSTERGRLDTIASLLKTAKNRTFLVTGHTADVGTAESQQELSVQRAKVIVDELVKRGFSPKRFMYQGKGGTEPAATNDTEEGRAQNRRVEITILH